MHRLSLLLGGTPDTHSMAGRTKSRKNLNELIGNQTRDPPAYSEVPRLTAPPRGLTYSMSDFML
jgi:hypothetical protein